MSYLIDLSIGEPSFETPSIITFRTATSLVSKRLRYTLPAGKKELRTLMASNLNAEGIKSKDKYIFISHGAKILLNIALHTILSPADLRKPKKVIVFSPYYSSFVNIPKEMGISCQIIKPSSNFHPNILILSAAELKEAKVLILTKWRCLH